MDPFAVFDRIRVSERRAVLATLVGMRGTSPRREGDRMWVGESGSILGSVTIGGCVDAEVLRAAPAVLAGSSPVLITVELGDDDALAMGLTCAGSVDVLLRPVGFASDATDSFTAAWSRLADHVGRGGRAVIVVPVPVDGATVPADRIMVVLDDDSTHGSLGHADLDALTVIHAADRLRRGGAGVVSLRTGDSDVPVYSEVHGRGPLLAIVGGSQIANPLARMAAMLGMHAIVIEGRETFAQRERFPDAAEVISGLPSAVIADLEFDAASAIVLIAHDYKFDVPVLETAVTTDAGYIGMLGGRKRAAAMKELLAERGMDARTIERIRMPIGLDIGGQSAAEIALSILAEVSAVRNDRPGTPMRDRTGGTDHPGSPKPRTAPDL
jgi:xanthine dehydrogenase accessory factor